MAKKEAVGLQMEAVYRARLQEAYTQARLFICSYFFLYKLDEIYTVQKFLLTEMKRIKKVHSALELQIFFMRLFYMQIKYLLFLYGI